MKPHQDAYGQMIRDHHRGLPTEEVVEREDGFVSISGGAPAYFAPFRAWPAHQRRALRFVRGRCLDVGCGAGRWSLELERRGHEVVAIDESPLAVRTCCERGVRDARVLPFTRVSRRLGRFDTIVMLGNNFGLFASERRARWMLRRLRGLTSERGRIVAETLDPYATQNHFHRAYHRSNRNRGRMGGQIRLRVRYGTHRTPWFDYLMVSPAELRRIVRGTGWRVRELVPPDAHVYAAVNDKES